MVRGENLGRKEHGALGLQEAGWRGPGEDRERVGCTGPNKHTPSKLPSISRKEKSKPPSHLGLRGHK